MLPHRPSRLGLACCALLALAALLSLSWRWAGSTRSPATAPSEEATWNQRGPIDPAFCGPLQIPLPPPPIDSPFGVHLYAASPKGSLHPYPVTEALDRLPPPAPLPTPSLPSPPALPSPASPADDRVPATTAALPTSPNPLHNETAEEDVATVVLILEEFRRAFGAMPMGEQNDEIVRRLQGENPKGIAVLPRSHPNLSPEGELLDRWGTPYRFHPESAWLTTVRSAGQDRQMWTRDDILSENSLPDQKDGTLTSRF